MTGASLDPESNSDVYSLGAYTPIMLSSILTFPERTATIMLFEQITRFSTVSDTRFFERRFFWTGRGVMDPPQIHGVIDGTRLRLARHGPLYRRGRYTAYLIDLGRVIPPGNVIEVCTTSKFVDESLEFIPYLAVGVMPTVIDVTVAVRLTDPVQDVRATYAPVATEGLIETPSSEVEAVTIESDGGIEYRIHRDHPSPGTYTLSWSLDRHKSV